METEIEIELEVCAERKIRWWHPGKKRDKREKREEREVVDSYKIAGGMSLPGCLRPSLPCR